MESEEKDSACFTLDGVVAEMVIEVEENQKSVLDDLGGIGTSPEKDKTEDQDAKKEDFLEPHAETDCSKVLENMEIEAKEEEEVKESEIEEHNASATKELSKISNEDSNQNLQKKRKRNESLDKNEDQNDNISGSRYPGRKRVVNKKYISEELTSGERKKTENVLNKVAFKDTVDLHDEKKIKPDINAKDVKDETLEEKKPTISDDFDEDVVNSDESQSKQDTLRKLPWRKNKDAPEVPDFKPKVMWWNGVGEGQGVKLGHIFGIRKRITSSRSVRPLFRVIFFQWPTEGQDLMDPILKFNGFPFNEMSYEFKKRRSMMKIMLVKTINNICDILGLKRSSKPNMITDILNFLLKPCGKIDVSQDPSMQPFVVLERIVLDSKFFTQALDETDVKKNIQTKETGTKLKENTFEVTSVRTTRNVAAKKKEFDTPKVSTRNSLKVSSVKRNSVSQRVTPISRKEVKPESGKGTKSSSSTQMPKPVVQEISKDLEKSKTGVKSKVLDKQAEVKSKTQRSSTHEKAKIDERLKVKFKVADKAKVKENLKVEELSKLEEETIEETSSSESESSSTSSDSETGISDLRRKIKKLKKEIKRKKNIKKMEKKKKLAKKKSKDSDSKKIKANVSNKLKSRENKKTKITEAKKSQEIDKISSENVSERAKEGTRKTDSNIEVNKSKKEAVLPEDSSETESSEESKQAGKLANNNVSPRKAGGRPQQRVVKPLRHFPQICESIQKANFSALQRLHILLFGASDKAENLKLNILAFGGFPFLEGSDEWKQKHFLLSLLAQNNLREYLNLLCIEYNEDDQPAMINKLMRFLAAPTENSLSEGKTPVIETEVVSSELVNKSPSKVQVKNKVKANIKKKKKEEPKPRRNRKVLMSEEDVKRLEANLAREQRALARDKPTFQLPHKMEPPPSLLRSEIKIIPKPPMTDPSQLNALLQTVYKRRALKAAGAVISPPNKGEITKLGDIENVKFLVVTANYRDLELLHHLIFLQPANKGRVRKNILDFDGFNFNEDSEKYKERMDFLNSSGYDVSKRLSFLLGLCPLHTSIPQQDLNELIMYFLMTPCKTKQAVPITQMPEYPADLEGGNNVICMKPNDIDKVALYQNVLRAAPVPGSTQKTTIASQSLLTSTPILKASRPKAKKSFSSSVKLSPLKKVLLPPTTSPILPSDLTSFKLPPGITAQKIAHSNTGSQALSKSANSMSVTPVNTGVKPSLLNSPKTQPGNTVYKLPASNLQVLNAKSNVAILETSKKLPTGCLSSNIMQNLQTSGLLQPASTKNLSPQQKVLHIPENVKNLIKTSTGLAPQEFIVQQQTPDGQQKTFKLVRLPSNHPLASAVKPAMQSTTALPVLPPQIITSNSLPTGIVVLKNSSVLQPSMQNVQNIVLNLNANKEISDVLNTSVNLAPNAEEFVLPDEGQSASLSASSSLNESSVEVLNPLEDSPPTDDELYLSIQEIILASDFEDITLRNVIERVSAQFPHHDLTTRHNYMKECVKRIIMGT